MVPYSPRQMFELVAAVDRYPEFLPWCRAARISHKEPGMMLAELIITFKHLSEQYTSKVVLNTPQSEHSPCSIQVNMTEGPFHHLTNEWSFTPHGDGTQIDFFLDFKFRSKFLEALIGTLFGRATEKMVSAFHARAQALYGSKVAS